MKKMVVLIFIMLFAFPMTVNATETENPTEVQQELFDKFDFTEIDKMLSGMFPEEKLGLSDLITGLISGDMDFSFELIKKLVVDQFSYELRTSRSGLIHVLLLVIISAIFANFSSFFKSSQVAEISFSMLYMLLITICLNNFRVLVDAAATNLSQLLEFMEVLGPIYFFAVAMATGSSTSISFYQLILLLILLVEMLILNFLIPFVQIYLMIRILSEFSSEIHLSKFADFIETVVSWSLKTLLAIVMGINLVQGLLTPAIDSVKRSFLVKGGEALPVIGDAIGGATEIVLGTALLIKNGIGVAGMIVCLIISLAPMIQMAVTTLMYQMIAALIQPISDKRMVNCVSSMADSVKLLLKIVVTSSVLFMITLAVVATTTGG